MKATVTTQYKGLTGIFDIGDKVDIEVIRYETDTEIFSEKTRFDSKISKHVVVYPAVIAPAGSFKGFRIKSKNGAIYNDHSLHCIIGYRSLGEVFTKDESNNSTEYNPFKIFDKNL